MKVKKFEDTFSHFDKIPACDRQVDGLGMLRSFFFLKIDYSFLEIDYFSIIDYRDVKLCCEARAAWGRETAD